MLSKWDKLVEELLNKSPALRFEDLERALLRVGYVRSQPRGGSSHYTFRKAGCMPITIPRHTPLKKVYIELVAQAVQAYVEEAGNE